MRIVFTWAMKCAERLKKSGVLIPLLHITIAWLLSAIIMAIVYPQLLVYHRVSLIRYIDSENINLGIFTFLSNIYHGGIQLWNPYDKMPLTFYYLAIGIHSLYSFFGTLLYPIVSLFYDSPGEAFQVTVSVVPFLTLSLIQIIGVYLLLRRFSSRLIVLLPCTIIGSTLLSPVLYFGVNYGDIIPLFPLLVHFVLCFFEDFRLNDALLAFAVMLVGAGTRLFSTVSYFYQAIHFFILCALVWSIVRRDSILRKCFDRETWRPNRTTFVKIGITLVLFVVVMAPWLILYLESYGDIDFALNIYGYGNRTENIFSVTEYFKRPIYFARQEYFLILSLDYQTNDWLGSWSFLGFGVFFLSFCGLILSRDKRKFIFFGAILLSILINSPRVSVNVGFLAHIINALTNPTKALPRTFHSQAWLMPYFFLPLIAMGLESLFSIAERRRNSAFADDEEEKQKMGHVKSEAFKNVSGLLVVRLTVGVATGMLLVGLPFLLSYESVSPVFFGRYSTRAMVIITTYIYIIMILLALLLTIFSKKVQSFISEWFIVCTVTLLMVSFVSIFVGWRTTLYLLVSTFISFVIIFLLTRVPAFTRRLPLVALLLLILFAIDAACLSQWMKIHASRHMIENLTVPGLERFGKVVLDYQNPKVLPFREYYSTCFNGNVKSNTPGTLCQIPSYFTTGPSNMQGLFFRYTNLGKFKIPGTNTKPKHASFIPFHQKRSLQVYLDRDQRIFFQAQLAVKDTPGVFDEILRQGLDRTIIVIDHDSPDWGPYEFASGPLPQPLKPPQRKFHTLDMMLREADMTYEDELALYWFDLPEGFTKHLTTSIYTRDSNLLGVKINNRELIPAQGRLVSPYTFDVQNIAEGKLVVALPRNRKWGHNGSVVFTYPAQNEIGITRVWRYEPDTLGLDYVAEEDGWFVMHYPFDKKWKVTIDGKPGEIYKANYCFMAVPVSKGNHRILFQYWPDTSLRFFLGLSYLMVLTTLGAVIYIGIRLEVRRNSRNKEG